MIEIKVGDLVRSFDFNHIREIVGTSACYVEGVVQEIVHASGCRRYRILCTRRVLGGKPDLREVGLNFYPPVNGTETYSGGLTSFVEKIEE